MLVDHIYIYYFFAHIVFDYSSRYTILMLFIPHSCPSSYTYEKLDFQLGGGDQEQGAEHHDEDGLPLCRNSSYSNIFFLKKAHSGGEGIPIH